MVPDVHRLHARERQLTSKISDAQYREVSHRQILESEIVRLKSGIQSYKKEQEPIRLIDNSNSQRNMEFTKQKMK